MAQDSEYRVTPEAFWGMTGPKFVISAAPREFLSRYGMPIDDRDGESLGTYVFTSISGAVVTVYYRANDVWSLLLKLVKPFFWRGKSPVELTVGASTPQDGLAFAQWLSAQLGVSYRRWP